MRQFIKPVKQITIITKDYHGLTADLAGNEINIETLDAKKINDIGVITLVVDQQTGAASPERRRMEPNRVRHNARPRCR